MIDGMNDLQPYFTYILLCSDSTLYTGYTPNLPKRVRIHNQGKGAKYTRSRLPVYLVHYEVFSSRHEAMSREYRIKQMSRKEKLRLIGEYGPSLSRSPYAELLQNKS